MLRRLFSGVVEVADDVIVTDIFIRSGLPVLVADVIAATPLIRPSISFHFIIYLLHIVVAFRSLFISLCCGIAMVQRINSHVVASQPITIRLSQVRACLAGGLVNYGTLFRGWLENLKLGKTTFIGPDGKKGGWQHSILGIGK